MKKFIEELKKTGDYQAVVHSVMDARKCSMIIQNKVHR